MQYGSRTQPPSPWRIWSTLRMSAAGKGNSRMKAAGKGDSRMKAAGKGDSRMKAAGKPISLILIDDNRLLREGIAAMIRTQPGFKVLALSADVDEALERAREARPDVILLDFGLVDHDSVKSRR